MCTNAKAGFQTPTRIERIIDLKPQTIKHTKAKQQHIAETMLPPPHPQKKKNLTIFKSIATKIQNKASSIDTKIKFFSTKKNLKNQFT